MLRGALSGLTRGLRSALLVAVVALPVQAQDAGLGESRGNVLVIDSEDAFARSPFGQAMAEEVDRESRALATENRRIEAELTEEEQALTARRPTMEPDAFRELADAFDEKVRRIREEQDAKTRAIGQIGEEARREFLVAAQPVLQQIMADFNVPVILELRSVFLVDEAANITDELVRRLNEAAGAPGEAAPDDTPGDPAPQTGRD
ncbi:OmpH family outer membrane protein [Oceanicola sp. 22II-s10i]|uniref:OmpH family outer membrane protein n=1 Tax=Oceanicola sp. 22II-s10i TaxID=1317116 RepID=UPI000B526467|nr:OmpH family outer membrane protein [Oceanicola sp. 22II-s10i]